MLQDMLMLIKEADASLGAVTDAAAQPVEEAAAE
jgi:hypothetical protein